MSPLRCFGCRAFIARQPTIVTCKRCGGLNVDARSGYADNGQRWSAYVGMSITERERLFIANPYSRRAVSR